ncbi:DNA polymerase epsilon catalytic subunit A [Toxocara canis]|uniref:DNA polymerase epsilon catalytic subunit n=1 Tax=Toxocara canis TaxID=6265 RepID=A0A0B2V450_TOXCA|nr:DNA polymerase epsilon catalytic subunit A [Toxocara canis]
MGQGDIVPMEPFVEARAAVHGFDMRIVIGFSKDSAGQYKSTNSIHMDAFSALNRELCAMRVEGIYESQVPIEFRALLELGCCCKLKSDKLSTFTVTAVELDQLEMVDDAEYLPDNSIRNAFYWEHRQEKRCVIAVVNSSAKDAIIVSVNAEFPNTMLLYVEDEDVNDMAPQFTALIVRSTIGDDSLRGQFVAKMIVDDVKTHGCWEITADSTMTESATRNQKTVVRLEAPRFIRPMRLCLSLA